MADNLAAARTILKTSMEKSKAFTFELHKTNSRLEHINQTLSSLQTSFEPNLSHKCTLLAVREKIELAIVPTIAVRKIFNSVHQLEKALSLQPCQSDLVSYLKIMKKLEEALKFLTSNCRLAVQWLGGIIEFLEENAVANNIYLLNVQKLSELLVEIQVTDQRARLNGGILFTALNKLEIQFESILTKNSVDSDKNCSIALFQIPELPIQTLQSIFDRLHANGRVSKCLSVYIEARVSFVRKIFLDMDLAFLDKPLTEFDDTQDFEEDIDKWCKYFEVAIKKVFDLEFSLCNGVFKRETDFSVSCFAEIAVQSSYIVNFLQFGMKITQCKKNPIKLIKLLDVFATLETLRVDFNRLFKGEACSQIQTLTRNLIKGIVNRSCEIFWELPFQVELQRSYSPPSDGSVPKLVTFVTNYCNTLLGDRYLPILTQVLGIYGNWKHENYDEKVLLNQFCSIIKEIGRNLDSWSQSHEELSLSFIFMMNNHSHFHNMKSTKLGDTMGESWIRAHEYYRDYYAALYFKQSWGSLLVLLKRDGELSSFPKRQKAAFDEAFDGIYKKHSNWVITDENLREKLCQLVIHTFLPVYRNYSILDENNSKSGKYTPQSLELMIQNLFKPKVKKSSSGKYTLWTHKIRNIVTDNHSLALTA
ncbi:hypothetical protein ACFE04_031748 [Oxalis oulophora]